MRKEEFLKQLAYLLQDISDEDREEAMSYYRDYLDEAGPENEEAVVEEFGSPERVAAIIRADVTGTLRDGGSFTETGFEDERFRDPNYQVAKRLDLPEEREMKKENDGYQERHYSGNTYKHDTYTTDYREYYAEKESEHPKGSNAEKKRWAGSVWKGILLGVLLLIASPFIVGAAGVVLGAVGIAFAAIVCVIVLTAAAFIVSVIVGTLGIGFVITAPLDSLFLLGIALIGIGLGLLGVALVAVTLGVILPFCTKAIWNGIRRLTGKGKEAA